jgi:hypothetical protein
MRIDEQTRESTSLLFLKEDKPNGRFTLKPVGTAFYLSEDLGRDRLIPYIVTARHVVDGSRPHGSLWVRHIRKDGKRFLSEIPVDSWWAHPNTDIAIAPLAIAIGDFGLRSIPLELLADHEWMSAHSVGIGDHVVAIGLFSQFFGEGRDAPIARFGRIALIPDELVRVPGGGGLPSMEFEAIFAELGSWSGQSGSPVWAYFSVDRDLFAGSTLATTIPNPRLLGIVHGHYNFPQNVRNPFGSEALTVNMNSGIAIIVPASKILEVLSLDRAVEHREFYVRVLREEGLID